MNELRLDQTRAWLQESMPKAFEKQVSAQERQLIASALLSYHWQEGFVSIRSAQCAYCITANDDQADLKALASFKGREIWDYRTFVSTREADALGIEGRLRIIVIHFLHAQTLSSSNFTPQEIEELWEQLERYNPLAKKEELQALMQEVSRPFLELLTKESLVTTLDLLLRSQRDDNCEFATRPEIFWKQMHRPSMQIMLAVKQVRPHQFLTLLMKLVKRHGLFVRRINATIVGPHRPQELLLVVFSLHGLDHRPVWEVTMIPEFLRELTMLKMLPKADLLERELVDQGFLSSNLAHLLRAFAVWAHQMLVPLDPHLYDFEHVKEAFVRHPELSARIAKLFSLRFHPEQCHLQQYEEERLELHSALSKLDTGHPSSDLRRKNILLQALHFIHHTLKTNFFLANKLALSFRLDPKILDHLPYNRQEIFPELPYAIFFIRGTQSFGFHIRFRDLARGGLRTILPIKNEQLIHERAQIFREAYNLAYTQQKKNKDIPEGGSKAALLLHPFKLEPAHQKALEKSLCAEHGEAGMEKLERLAAARKRAYLHHSQKCFIDSLLVLINSHPSGMLKRRGIIDYFQRPEHIYLGPDENMHNEMIEWIASYSCSLGYAAGPVFISSHPQRGINHKEYGVTSLGVHTYMKEMLAHLRIDPKKQPFTVKMSGGPDGDVAGNCLLLLAKEFPKTAKVVAITDVSGTIHDSQGLDLQQLEILFERQQPIRFYPPSALSPGSFLLDRFSHKEDASYCQQTLCWRGERAGARKSYLSGHEMNFLFRHNVHRSEADIFIPAGGRPRTLNFDNVDDFMLEDGRPSSRAIIEGANLYLTPRAREELQERGVAIFKDSSANKGGVMSSSMEVLYGLTLEEEELLEHKEVLCRDILVTIEKKARLEAQLLLQSGLPLTQASDQASQKINLYTDQLYAALMKRDLYGEEGSLQKMTDHALLAFAPPFLRKNYQKRLLTRLPQTHKMAMVATHLASQLIYRHGLSWRPSLEQALPLLLSQRELTAPFILK